MKIEERMMSAVPMALEPGSAMLDSIYSPPMTRERFLNIKDTEKERTGVKGNLALGSSHKNISFRD